MKTLLAGLQGRFTLVVVAAFVLLAVIVALLLERQWAMQREVRRMSAELVHELSERDLRIRGEALSVGLADALANPLYYSDLAQIGVLVRNTLKQTSVSYVRVHDTDGHLVHDGSPGIAGYGQPMADALAAQAVSRREVTALLGDDVLEVVAPISLGEQRLGGVRIGLALAHLREDEDHINALVSQRLDEVGRRGLLWMVLVLACLPVVAVLVVLYLQRTLVAPIRGLAAAARRIEDGDYATGPQPQSTRRDELGDLLRAFARMSESIARHDREVRHMAYTDALTGLTNRLGFREGLDLRLDVARRSGSQLALLFADVDDFKRVNDTLGHEAGDETLLQFAGRIGVAVAEQGGDDPLLARFGGDEFVILLQGEDVQAMAVRLADRLVQDLRLPLQVQGRELFLGTSLGITLFPDDADDATGLLKNGDIAMYQAKLAGKNCHRFYSRAIDHAGERRLLMEHQLRGAWERGEIRLVYQPIFRTADRRLVGVETLMRWQHPALGSIPPSVFIDVAEQSGLIEELGPKVLRAACMDAARWPVPAGGPALFVSVNVSPRQLRGADLVDVVARSLAESGLPASRLHIELTETAVIGDEMLAATLLEKLHRTGVKVWLDDFGTGFSGLSQLRHVPVDGVKIDKSFIADLQRDPDDLALTTAIISMAHSLGITVVAEGIEQEGQYTLLRERGCDLGQGFWFSRPLPGGDLLRLLQA